MSINYSKKHNFSIYLDHIKVSVSSLGLPIAVALERLSSSATHRTR